MNEMTTDIYKWLKELDKLESAKFLKANCNIHSNYVDVCWDANDRETVIVSINVTIPLKKHKELSLYQQYITDIEQSIFDYNPANGMYANSIEWTPVLSHPSGNPIQAIHDIKENATEDYMVGQIDLMNESLVNNPHLSIGIAKELIETFCKSILKAHNVQYDKDWDIPKLTKETNKILFSFAFVDIVAQQSLQKMVSGITTMIQGITELRNSYGSGHGHEKNFKQLDIPYIRFIVSSTSEIILLWKNLANKKGVQPLP